jgi:hypothetical protein
VAAARPRELKNTELLAVANRISDELQSEVALAEQAELAQVAATAGHHHGPRREA